ncbi:MAG: CoA transferase [Pseudomonadota bacterium]
MTANDVDNWEQAKTIWQAQGLAADALADLTLPESDPGLPTSFQVSAVAQISIGLAALAAATIYHQRSGARQQVSVPKAPAERECTAYFRLDENTPDSWEKFSGLYPAMDGYVRVHANFDHHRDGVLQLLELGPADQVAKEDVAAALQQWSAEDFETAAGERGLVVAAARSFAEWDSHAHAMAMAAQPLLTLTRLDDAEPLRLPRLAVHARPLQEVKVLELTRILAGPIAGRTLAAYGAEVLLINAPQLPNIASVIDTSRGKRSAHLDLLKSADQRQLQTLLADAHVFMQGYRPGAMAGLGLSPTELAALRPGLIYASLSAYGDRGPWSQRRGFDSLVQTVSGFNHAEAQAAGELLPKSLPVPILDYATGFLLAFGTQAALLRQAQEGGSWHVQVSLLQTANWLRSLGRVDQGLARKFASLRDHLEEFPCAAGRLQGPAHAAQFSATPARWQVPSAYPGAHPPSWQR